VVTHRADVGPGPLAASPHPRRRSPCHSRGAQQLFPESQASFIYHVMTCMDVPHVTVGRDLRIDLIGGQAAEASALC
jgi:hypothetical protein